MLIDLQLHSTYSDGYLTPTQLARFIANQGVKVAALTDHNTVSGLDEFRRACRRLGIKPITGLELYIKFHQYRFNLLWYNFDDTDPDLHNLLRESQMRRRRQVRMALTKLKEKRNFIFDVNKLLDRYNHYVPINHIIDDITAVPVNWRKIKKELGLAHPREGDIIAEYFRNKEIYILKNAYIDIDRVLRLKEKIGGQLILCHPAKYLGVNIDLVKELKRLGVVGVEKMSPHHSYGAIMYIQHWAREFDLIETGGSDFHRFEGGGHLVQDAWQYFRVDTAHLRKIKRIIE